MTETFYAYPEDPNYEEPDYNDENGKHLFCSSGVANMLDQPAAHFENQWPDVKVTISDEPFKYGKHFTAQQIVGFLFDLEDSWIDHILKFAKSDKSLMEAADKVWDEIREGTGLACPDPTERYIRIAQKLELPDLWIEFEEA